MAGDRDEIDEAPETDAAPREPAPPPPAAPRWRWRRWVFGILGFIVFFPILALVIWTFGALSYTYSSGERSGYIQKFSRKGWLCKTWEGELAQVNMPGAMTEKFYFTVRNDSVATVIDSLNRTWDGKVSLHYEQHRGIPFRCFGETEYFVDRAVAVTPAGQPARAPTAPTPEPTTTPAAPPTPAPRP